MNINPGDLVFVKNAVTFAGPKPIGVVVRSATDTKSRFLIRLIERPDKIWHVYLSDIEKIIN
jgi:hypothetical protein